MENTIYIKASQSVLVQHTDVTLKDFLSIFSMNPQLNSQVQSLSFHHFSKKSPQQMTISILAVIEMIHKHFPDVTIQNLGEEDILLRYAPVKKRSKLYENLLTTFICFVAFFGGGYAIMAYNTDSGVKELFTYLSMLFLGNATSGVACLIVTYSIGLALGMLIFFNHIGFKKITTDPSPLEIQMRLYEEDLNSTIIQNADRQGETIDVKGS